MFYIPLFVFAIADIADLSNGDYANYTFRLVGDGLDDGKIKCL